MAVDFSETNLTETEINVNAFESSYAAFKESHGHDCPAADDMFRNTTVRAVNLALESGCAEATVTGYLLQPVIYHDPFRILDLPQNVVHSMRQDYNFNEGLSRADIRLMEIFHQRAHRPPGPEQEKAALKENIELLEYGQDNWIMRQAVHIADLKYLGEQMENPHNRFLVYVSAQKILHNTYNMELLADIVREEKGFSTPLDSEYDETCARLKEVANKKLEEISRNAALYKSALLMEEDGFGGGFGGMTGGNIPEAC